MPQVIQFKNTSEQLENAITEARALFEKLKLPESERVALLPWAVQMLAEKPAAVLPDPPPMPLLLPDNARH